MSRWSEGVGMTAATLALAALVVAGRPAIARAAPQEVPPAVAKADAKAEEQARAAGDTLKDIHHVRYMMYRDYYLHPNIGAWSDGQAEALMAAATRPFRTATRVLSGDARITPSARGGALAWACSADDGQVCDGGDFDKGICDEPDFYCHSYPKHFLDVVTRAGVDHPESGFLIGQAVYAMVKYLMPIRAMRLVGECQAADWWCDALHGYALQRIGDPQSAAHYMRKAMDEAPDSVSCAYTDATWLVGEWDVRQSPYAPPTEHSDSTWDCVRRRAVSDTIWWLSDPLYSVPGNARWTESVTRFLTARFQREIDEAKPWRYDIERRADTKRAAVVRRGPWDSFNVFKVRYTGKQAARYHFVPTVGANDLSDPEWHLEAHLNQEGYTPPGRPFSEIPVQVARFRHDDSLRIAVATTLRDIPVEPDPDSAAWLIFTDGPGSFPLALEGRVHDDRSVFVGQVAPRRYVTSLEVHGDSTIGWHRQVVDPLDTGGPGLSDLLLYRPLGSTPPDSLLPAAGLMLGSTTVVKDEGLGVYWETYGLPTDSSKAHVSFTVTLVPSGGGVGAVLGRLIPGGRQERGRVAWTEPGTAGTHRRAVELDLTDVDAGEYTLVLRAAWPGQPPLERRLDVTVE